MPLPQRINKSLLSEKQIMIERSGDDQYHGITNFWAHLAR
jgi:hypothetical protein